MSAISKMEILKKVGVEEEKVISRQFLVSSMMKN